MPRPFTHDGEGPPITAHNQRRVEELDAGSAGAAGAVGQPRATRHPVWPSHAPNVRACRCPGSLRFRCACDQSTVEGFMRSDAPVTISPVAVLRNLGHETNGGVFLGIPAQPPQMVLAGWEFDGRAVNDEPKHRHSSISARREAAGSRRLPHPPTVRQRCRDQPGAGCSQTGRAAKARLVPGRPHMPLPGRPNARREPETPARVFHAGTGVTSKPASPGRPPSLAWPRPSHSDSAGWGVSRANAGQPVARDPPAGIRSCSLGAPRRGHGAHSARRTLGRLTLRSRHTPATAPGLDARPGNCLPTPVRAQTSHEQARLLGEHLVQLDEPC